MRFLIVPIGQEPPDNEGQVTNVDFIKFLNDMSAFLGVAIPIAVGLKAWNTLGKSGRWKNSKQARNDPQFQQEFIDMIQDEI